MKELNLLSEVAFASFLNYSPKGDSEEALKSKRVRDTLKSGPPPEKLKFLIDELHRILPTSPLREFFGREITVVPAPRSAPIKSGSYWPPQALCNLMVQCGLAKNSVAALERITPVVK